MADDVLVNLRVLSRLQENDRLNCTGTFFAIETGVLTKVWRWLRQETREKTLSRIADVMDRASRVPHAHAFAEQAREGLERLKITYAACPTTVARLDHIMVERCGLLRLRGRPRIALVATRVLANDFDRSDAD